MRPNELEKFKLLQKILQILETEPLSRTQIMKITGRKKTAVINALHELRYHKKIHIAEWIIDGHCKMPLYKTGNQEDATCIRKCDGVKLKEIRKVHTKPIPKKPIKPDIHSAWLFNPI